MATPAVSPSGRTIGWIGLGALGLASARRASETGWQVCGSDADPGRSEAAREAGIDVVDDARAVAERADELVVCCVRDAGQVQDVLLGPRGALDAAPHLTGIVMSSISVEAMTRLAGTARDAGATMIAAPVLGNPTSAATGESVFLLSGDAGGRGRTRPLLADLGRSTLELGEHPGSAQAMKLVSQLVQIVGMLTTFAGVELAGGYGLSAEAVRDVVAATEPSWTTDNWDYAAELWRRRDPASSLGLFAKDIDAAVTDARAAGLDLTIVEAAQRMLHARLTPDN